MIKSDRIISCWITTAVPALSYLAIMSWWANVPSSRFFLRVRFGVLLPSSGQKSPNVALKLIFLVIKLGRVVYAASVVLFQPHHGSIWQPKTSLVWQLETVIKDRISNELAVSKHNAHLWTACTEFAFIWILASTLHLSVLPIPSGVMKSVCNEFDICCAD